MHPNPVLEINFAGFVTFANQAVRKILVNLTPPGRLYDLLPSDWKSLNDGRSIRGKEYLAPGQAAGEIFCRIYLFC